MLTKIIICCSVCNGFAVSKGIGESERSATFCRVCEGTGKEEKEVELFEGKKRRKDIDFVTTKGFVWGSTDRGEEIPYEEFLSQEAS